MKSSKIYRRTLVSGLLVSAFFPAVSSASGFALIETNARGQGNAYAGAAAHTPDASTIFFNPAGMMELSDDQLVVAAHIVSPSSSFINNGSSNADGSALSGKSDDGGFDAFIPNLYWVKSIDENMKFGLGVNAPFGLAIKYNDDWVGRYHAVESDLQILNFNPSIAYQVNEQLSIGGGLNFMIADVVLSSAVDFAAILGQTPGTGDGFVELTGDNFSNPGISFNLGLQYNISEETTLGVSYRSEVDLAVEGEADFTVPTSAALLVAGGRFLDTGLTADITLPASLSMSIAHQLDKITLLADITWTGWSSFEELRVKYDNSDQPDSVTTEDWDDVLRYSLGFDYQYSDDIILRAGIALDESPVPDAEHRTPRLPGSDRTWFSFGASYSMNNEMSVDVGFSHLEMDSAPVDHTFESSQSTLAATLTGEYDATVDILSVQLNWNY